MKVLLTDVTGVVGSRVLDILLKKNHDVYVLVHNPARLEEFQHKGVHALSGNAEENGSWLGQLPEELDYVINSIVPQLPARVSLKQIEETYAPLMFNITKNLLYAATKTKAKHFYQTADAHIYLNTGNVVNERTGFNRDAGNYGRLFMEMIPYVQSQKGIPVTVCVHGLIYDSTGNTIPEIPATAGRLPIVGGGENFMQLTHADDLAAGIVFAIEKNCEAPVLNIVDDKPVTQKEFIQILAMKRQQSTAPVPKFLATPLFGEVLTNTLSESLQVNNDDLKAMGYWLKFPDIRAGFALGLT